jgi:hypothetical protein
MSILLNRINHYFIEHGTFYEAKQLDPANPNNITVIGPNEFSEEYDAQNLLDKLERCTCTNDVIDVIW